MEFAKHVKVLTGEADWPIWKRKVRDLLDYHEGAIDCIDNRLVKPEPLSDSATEAEKRKYKAESDLYRKANSYAKSMITSMVSDSVYQKIMDKETAHETWTALKDQFEATSQDQLFKICADFFAFVWTSGDDVSTHVAKLRTLWNELNNGLRQKNQNTLPDLILVCKLLHILPSSFNTFKSGWMMLSKDDEKTFEELSLQLTVFERNSGQQKLNESQEALYTKSNKQKENLNRDKQRFNSSPTQSKRNNECNYCHKPGHWVRQCRKWIADGRPARPARDSSNYGDQSNVANIALVSIHNEVLAAEKNSDNWWVDNGATRHVTSRSDWFTTFTKFQSPCSIKAAGEECLDAIGSGVIEVISEINGRRQNLLLKDVWLVPKIAKNLFSPLAAHDKNPVSTFESTVTSCKFSVNRVPVLTGVREQGGSLFKANIKAVNPRISSSINIAESRDLLQLYHERWGHQDKRHIKEKLELELNTKVKLEQTICEPCIYGKAHRLPFGTRRKATKPGELISTDVCGPFYESFQKKRYLVVFKDSYSKFRYSFVIKQKSEVKTVLKEMLVHAEKQGHNIKELLSDNGGEFDNAEVRDLLQRKGVTQRLTAPYTPQQNGGSERENRTIVEMARTFMHSNPEVQFPQAIWAELVTAAVYILNRTGKSSEGKISPYELWFGKKPRISHLRIIASTCYFHIPVQKRHKMDKKAEKGFLVGYDGNERYRIYVPKERQVFLSRDVIFHEVLRNCDSLKIPFKSLPSAVEEESSNDSETTKLRISKSESEPENASNSEETESESDEDTHENSENNTRQLRRRSRIKPPTYYDEFVMVMTTNEEPQSYKEALQRSDSEGWKKAMDSEMDSLVENNTFELSELPRGSKAIPCKWVFRLKLNPDGSVLKYKARLVAKGYGQRKGIDFTKTFSPVARLQTIRLMLAIASTEKMNLVQFDVSTAFLYGELEETIYMTQPDGYNDNTSRVWKLKKSLYGLKQSPRCWNKRIGKFLEDLDFKVSLEEPCLFVRERNNNKIILALYVDDGIVAATSKKELEEFINQLRTEFKITSKDADYFLGLEIKILTNGDIKICQTAYAQKILERFNFAECNPVSSPMTPGQDSGKVVGKEHNFPYRQAVGSLMYLMLGSRPDLAYAVSFLSRTLENPTAEDVAKLKRVFRYIAGSLDLGIVYRQTAEIGILDSYSDADFGGCTKTGRSTSGILVKYADGAISWSSQRQSTVAESTAEAEIVAASEAAKEVIWLSRLLNELSTLKKIPVIRIDNEAAVRLAENPENHRRTKHIQRKHFFIRELISNGKLEVNRVPAEDQLADGLTKPLPAPRIRVLCDKMGIK